MNNWTLELKEFFIVVRDEKNAIICLVPKDKPDIAQLIANLPKMNRIATKLMRRYAK